MEQAAEPRQAEAWIQRLQHSLRLEAEGGYADLQGRTSRFSDFLNGALCAAPAALDPIRQQLLALSRAYGIYGDTPPLQRRQLVVRTRQLLHRELQRLRPAAAPGPPRLTMAASASSVTAVAASNTPASGSSARTARQACGVAAERLQPSTPLADVHGMGSRLAGRLARLGLLTAGDLIRYYPRDYVDYSRLQRIEALEPGTTATVVATVRRCHSFTSRRNSNLTVMEIQLQDPTGRLKVTRFFVGKRFGSTKWQMAQCRLFPVGATVAASGLVKRSRYGLSLLDPVLEALDQPGQPLQSGQIGRVLAVYPLAAGIGADTLRKAVATVLPCLQRCADPLPPALRDRWGLMALGDALKAIHQPADSAALDSARRRLVFDEFLLLQLGLLQRRARFRQRKAVDLCLDKAASSPLLQRFQALLPFSFTAAQERTLAQIRADLHSGTPMSRLLQGDVGSGKTVVAVAALLEVIAAGGQGALMAPTEVLAMQHYRKLCDWCVQLHLPVALLTGSTTPRQRRSLLRDLVNGSTKLLVGTHALLEDPVVFQTLGLVVIDEQHRFGVHQRNRLLAKGAQPHLLSMTATPIPRTLALSLHGDLDVSQIDELPPGRTPIRTQVFGPSRRQLAYDLIRREIQAGQRAYVIFPLVEESDKLALRSAVEEHRHLSDDVFPDCEVALLHGRLPSAEKQAAIDAFARGEAQILVSTTVVEVGVDVPEASVMLIDHADRFGLAQLHQLRGRVGRGAAASHCLLLSESKQAVAHQRLELLVRSNDGFEIAEMDLRFRGPGQVLGTRQSGLPDLALASLSEDGDVLDQARDAARELIDRDPALAALPLLRQKLEQQQQRLIASAQLN